MSDKKLPMLGGPKIIGEPPAHVMRMLAEADELAQRVMAIDVFTDTPQFDALHETQRHLLQAQHTAMQTYLRILLLRINMSKKPDPNAPALDS